jgi:cytochrome P450
LKPRWLALRAQAHLGARYLGLAVADDRLPDFALWCLAIGHYAFGYRKPGTVDWDAGRGAGAQLAATMRQSIVRAREAPDPDTLIGRMVAADFEGPAIDAALTGLLSALVPASTQAITNAAQVLLGRPRAMAAAQAAAWAGDDSELERVLVEAVRFKPIFPGPFRDCVKERVIGANCFVSVRARPGDLVLPATQSAMFDRRRVNAPRRFDPGRAASDSLVFGYGPHWCFGFAVGRMQLVETLKPLLQRGFRQTKADRAAVSYFGTVPEHFPVHLD